jgi:hypothetical protein
MLGVDPDDDLAFGGNSKEVIIEQQAAAAVGSDRDSRRCAGRRLMRGERPSRRLRRGWATTRCTGAARDFQRAGDVYCGRRARRSAAIDPLRAITRCCGMHGDPVDRRGGPLTSWPLILLILILVFLALAGVDPDVTRILRDITGWL